MIGDGVDVEEYRAWNMAGEKFGLGVALLCREIKRPVDDNSAGFADLAGEPFGGFKPFARWI